MDVSANEIDPKIQAHLDQHPTHYLDPKDGKLKTKKGKLVKLIKGKGNKSKGNKDRYKPKNPEKAAAKKAQRLARKKWRAQQKAQREEAKKAKDTANPPQTV